MEGIKIEAGGEGGGATCGKRTNKDGAAANCFTNNIHH